MDDGINCPSFFLKFIGLFCIIKLCTNIYSICYNSHYYRKGEINLESIDIGILSILPPIIAIGLALVTKEVISSLIIGILSGTLMYSIATASGVFDVIVKTFDTTTNLMGNKIGENTAMILFLAFLGTLVVLITKAGGSRAYGNWASKKIKSRTGAKLATSLLGSCIFIDDYFNCLTVGTVMKPVTDKHKISHAKLSYLIDATAAPICIIAPVSSWAASVISYMDDTGLNGMETFVNTIPLNLYALLSIVMLVLISISKFDFGPMAKFEKDAMENGILDSVNTNSSLSSDELNNIQISSKGKVIDLILPIVILIITCITSMLYVGGFFDSSSDFYLSVKGSFGNTDAGTALALGGFVTLLFTMVFYISRKVLSFNDFMSSFATGVKSMVPVYIILTLAWTIGGVCRELLNTGNYVGGLVESSNMPTLLIPFIVFVVAGFLSFSMGTSWGTFGILIPIVADICMTSAPELTVIAIAATLSGSVFGDHCSPISDTTILSSTGASCNHLDHVRSQMVYALVVAGVSAAGYIIAGITKNTWITLISSIVLLVITFISIKQITQSKAAKKLS